MRQRKRWSEIFEEASPKLLGWTMKANAMLELVRINRDRWEEFLERMTAQVTPREAALLREIFEDLKDEFDAKERAAAKHAEAETSGEGSSGEELPVPGSTPLGKGGEAKKKGETARSQRTMPGHGRRGAGSFTPTETIHVSGQFPSSQGEAVSTYSPQYRIVIKGSLSLRVCLYILPRRRLASGELQTTALPPEVGPLYGKADAEAAAHLVLAHYKMGATLYGMEKLQAAVGIPLSQSTQWDVIAQATDVVCPIFTLLPSHAANASLIHIDSTGKTILSTQSVIRARQAAAVAAGKKPESVRHGMRTVLAIAKTQDGHGIVYVKTGEQHAGEVLDDLLAQRTAPEKVILEADGSAENTDHTHREKTIVALCNAHAYRKLREHQKDHPGLSEVVELYAMVFANEERCRQGGLPSDVRLELHAAHSLPLMEEIRKRLLSYLYTEQRTTPNSLLGIDIRYFLKRYEALTRFCHVEGVPLDNNENEREIKVTVKHRKNSLFYKTPFGAYVGDIWMSLIETAILNKVNPWKWIVDVLRHPLEVREAPELWLPWRQGLVEA